MGKLMQPDSIEILEEMIQDAQNGGCPKVNDVDSYIMALKESIEEIKWSRVSFKT